MILSTLRMLLGHKFQTIKRLDKVELPPPFRGRPELYSAALNPSKLKECVETCPTGAITSEPFALDMGKCLFCGECQRTLPNNIRFTQSYKVWSLTREGLIITAEQNDSDSELDEQEYKKLLRPLFRHSLKLRQVSAGGDGANEMELNAAGNVNFDMKRYGIEFTASPRHADGLVLTGPITRKMAGALQITYDAMAEPKVLIAVGAEAISGGLYANSEEIDRSFLDSHTVNLYVAGNPAHPLAFIGGVRELTSNHKREGSNKAKTALSQH